MQKSNKIKIICLAGMMAALYVCLDFLAVSVSAPLGGTLKISISGLPVIIVAIFCGPWWGAATGFIGAFVGQLITYGVSATTVLWVLPAVVRGITVGYLFRAFKKSTKSGILVIETCISSLIVTILNTGAMLIEQKLYGYYSSYLAIFVAIPSRLIAGILTAIVFSLMLPTIINTLNKHFKI
ncbi:MAG: ECF transporter S component [Clostridia bacterium]|nr:ECF transporter S component [Clostridia bacterium]